VNEAPTFPEKPIDTASAVTATEQDNRSLAVASWALLLFFTVVHLILIFQFPLAPDETYYWQWSRHLDWGYYDQGPMVAWWIHASCLLFGNTALGVRFGIVVSCFLTQLFLYLLARDLFGRRNAFLSLLVAAMTPFALIGSFIATYDPLVVMFWSAAMYFAVRALFFNSRLAWYGVGLSFGLGLLSKHTMLVFAPCLLLFLLTSREHRQWLLRPEPYKAMVLAGLVFLPNIIWQANHEWITFKHLFLLTGKGLDQPFLRRFGDFLGSQIALMTPLLCFGMIGAMFWAGKKRRDPAGTNLWFAFCMGAPVLLIFLLLTVKSKVQANWAVCGWMTPPILWIALLEAKNASSATPEGEISKEEPGVWNAVKRAFRLFKRPYAAAAFILLAFLSAILSWPDARAAMHVGVPYKWDQMNKLYGGAELGAVADRVRKEMEMEDKKPVTVGAVTYDNASRMAFYMTGQPEAYCFFLGTRLNSYYLWEGDFRPLHGRNALIADDYPPDDPHLPKFKEIFDRVVPVAEPITVYRLPLYKEPVHVYYLYKCYGYHPNILVEKASGG
jgi:hypothetical protein